MTPRTDIWQRRAPVVALLSFTAFVAVVTFTLSFVGLRDYGQHVVNLSPWVAWLVPVGVDCLTLAAVAATFALRLAPWHVRLYAWLVFGVALLASVAGNLSHAVRANLPVDGQVGAAAWPALLALASHLVVVTWRHLERNAEPAPATRAAVPARRTAAAVTRRVTVTAPATAQTDKLEAFAALRRDGKTIKDAGAELGMSERTAARYAKKLGESDQPPNLAAVAAT